MQEKHIAFMDTHSPVIICALQSAASEYVWPVHGIIMRRIITEDDLVSMNKRMGHETVVPRSMPCKVSSTSPTYRSKWEAAYASKLELEKHAGLIKAWWYEPFSLWLPGKVRYKPDFMVQYVDQPVYPTHICAPPRLEIIEVKGWSRNRRDGITRLKIAAALFPCFVWRQVYRTKNGGWDGHYL